MSFFPSGITIQVLALSEWLEMAAGQHGQVGVDLPPIQRGFVWKPHQIIDLWDSLLMGMPIGALMVSELQQGDASIALTATASPTMAPERLGLVDGQQRTLAMLIGWQAFAAGNRHRLWVDLADEPAPGHLVRLRITTLHQPFGYRRDDPNAKLSLDHRRRAKEAYMGEADTNTTAQQLLARARPHPAGAACSGPLDFGDVVQDWRNKTNVAAWQRTTLEKMKTVATVVVEDGNAILKSLWNEAQEEKIKERLQNLSEGLDRVFSSQIPLIKVAPHLFQIESAENVEPPLARLFQRIGSNATRLSDADYIYAVLKHLEPKVHGMVENLHAQPGVASYLTATDLVMSALRLAAVQWKGVRDHDNPGKEDFHRLVMRPENDSTHNRQKDMHSMLSAAEKNSLTGYFAIVQANLQYQGLADRGLPALMLPHLGRPLVQVLLRLAQAGYLHDPADENLRAQGLRLALWWMRWVSDAPKASRIAFQVIKNSANGVGIDRQIAQEIVQSGAGWMMQNPAAIAALGLDDSTRDEQQATLKHHSRFSSPENDNKNHQHIRDFYRHWWQPWSHYHPMLLWLQRDYVESSFNTERQAGIGEDTPYDYDHILPSSHWGGYWSTRESAAGEDFRDARSMLGHGIGNIRVWDSSRNRRDGDSSPAEKLCLPQHLSESAIDPEHKELWNRCSPAQESDKREWSRERALAFQKAVESRAFFLYRQLYEDAGFEQWE